MSRTFGAAVPFKVPAPDAPLDELVDFIFFILLAGYQEHPAYLAWQAARDAEFKARLPKPAPTLQEKYDELLEAVREAVHYDALYDLESVYRRQTGGG